MEIRDKALAPSGEQKIYWAARNMPVLGSIAEDLERERPFEGLKIALSVHFEAKTACLCRALQKGGAEMHVTGSNPLSTQDDVAAAIASGGIDVNAWYGATEAEYTRHLRNVLECGPNIIIDDGGDLVTLLHSDYPELIPDVIGGCEETTTGLNRLRAMEAEGRLRFPMLAVNDADCKHLFDNRYGTGQSVFDGIDRTTNLVVAGKRVVVSGYGWCGKGVAMRAKGLGARVIVTETDAVRALEAHMDGFEVMPMRDAAPVGDLFVTVTGRADVIKAEHFPLLKDGAILCNAGHFDVEIAMRELERQAVETREARRNIVGYTLKNGRTVFVLGQGRLVNLACGDGHPVEIMDMSFAVQALSARYLAKNRGRLPIALIPVPREIDGAVAKKKLSVSGIEIDA